MIKLLRDFRVGPQAVSLPTCRTVAEAEEAVSDGTVTVRLDELQTFISVRRTQWLSPSRADVIEFTGYFGLYRTDWHCRIELDRSTLHGWLHLL